MSRMRSRSRNFSWGEVWEDVANPEGQEVTALLPAPDAWARSRVRRPIACPSTPLPEVDAHSPHCWWCWTWSIAPVDEWASAVGQPAGNATLISGVCRIVPIRRQSPPQVDQSSLTTAPDLHPLSSTAVVCTKQCPPCPCLAPKQRPFPFSLRLHARWCCSP